MRGLKPLTLPETLYSMTKLFPNAVVDPRRWRSGEIAALKKNDVDLSISLDLSSTGVVGTGSISYQRTRERDPLAIVCCVQKENLFRLGLMACTAWVLRASSVSSNCGALGCVAWGGIS